MTGTYFADPDLEALVEAWLTPGPAEEREALLASVAPRLSVEARESLWTLAAAGPSYGEREDPAARAAGLALWRLCARVAERGNDTWTLARAKRQIAALEPDPALAGQAREEGLAAALTPGLTVSRESLGDLLAGLLDGLSAPMSRVQWALRWRDAASGWGDRGALARAARALGEALWRGHDAEEAAGALEQAASLYEENDEPVGQATVRLMALEIAFAAGDAVAAVRHLTALSRVRPRLVPAPETDPLIREIDALIPPGPEA